MIAGVYNIKVKGLGLFQKRGLLSIRLVDNQISGSITLYNKEIPFNFGTFLGNKIELEGNLPLPVGTINYSGKGEIMEGNLSLTLETEKGTLIVTGKRKGD